MSFARIISKSKLETTNYANVFSVAIICFIYLQSSLYSWLQLQKIAESVNASISFFKIINYNFSSLIFSAIPLTIILTISREFSSGYALKLISNGVSRFSYFKSKYLLAGILAVLSTLLYLLIILICLFLLHEKFPDKILFIKSISYCAFFSLSTYIIVISIVVLVRNWQYSVLIYYGYSVAENFFVYQFGEKIPLLNYLPFHINSSVFQFEKKLISLSDYLLTGWIAIFFCFIIAAVSYHFFKKADL